MTIPSPIATAADYADALLSARRFKNILFWLLLAMLVLQLGIFLLAKYTNLVLPASALADAATQPASTARTLLSLFLQYLTGIIDFLGLVFSIVFSLTLLLILQILIMGRLLGVSHLTTAYVTSLLLAVLLFPWQAFLNFSDLHNATFRLPGVLYTWAELVRECHFENLTGPAALLKWWRFIGFPLVAIALLLTINSRSRRGLRRALGEIDTTPPQSSVPTPQPPQ